MYVLQLNPMQSNAETVVAVMRAESEQALIEVLQAEAVPPYTDGQWRKSFRQGGPLEWFNHPANGEAWIGVPAIVDVGSREDWMHEAGERFDAMAARIPAV